MLSVDTSSIFICHGDLFSSYNAKASTCSILSIVTRAIILSSLWSVLFLFGRCLFKEKFKENLCHLLVYSHFLKSLLSSAVCVVHMHVVRVTGVLSISHLRDSFLVGLCRSYLIIWLLGNSLKTMSVFHSQVKMRLWCYSHGHTVSHSFVHLKQVFLLPYTFTHSWEMSSKGVFLSPRSASVTLMGLTHSNKPSCSGIKNTPPFKNPRSDLWSAWELCFFCLLECDELARSHPVLASFLLHGFFPQCSLIQGWIEERLEPRNLFGIIATIEALCARPAGEREKEKTGVLFWCALLEETTTRLWLTLIVLCGLHYWVGLGLGMHLHSFILEWDGRGGIWPLTSVWPHRRLENSK